MNELDLPLLLGEFLIKSAVVIALGFAVVAAAKALAPAAKHRLWLWALGASLGLPALLLLPRWEVLPSLPDAPAPSRHAAVSVEPVAEPVQPIVLPFSSIERRGEPIASPVDSAMAPAGPTETVAVPAIRSGPVAEKTASAATLSWPWVLAGIWALGAVVIALRSLLAGSLLRRIRRDSAEPSRNILSAFEDLREASGVARPVALLISPQVKTPCTWGILRPQIVLPGSVASWTSSEREMILRHELAHVERRDGLAVLLSRIFLALNWVNPMAWAVLRQTERFREDDCDIRVLHSGHSPVDYAEMLFRQASAGSPPLLKTCATAIAESGTVEHRIRQILNPGRLTLRSGRITTIGFVVLAALLLVSVVAIGILGRDRQFMPVNFTKDAVSVIAFEVNELFAKNPATTEDEVARMINFLHEASVINLQIDSNGKAVDPFGTAFRVENRISGSKSITTVVSAGPDGEFGTQDDISDFREREMVAQPPNKLPSGS